MTKPNYSFLKTMDVAARPATCRKAGCVEVACRDRFEPPGHAWNAFCTEHADEVEAKLAVRLAPQLPWPRGVKPPWLS